MKPRCALNSQTSQLEMHRRKRCNHGKQKQQTGLSLIELPSQGACSLHQLLEFVLLHLGLASSLCAEGVHGTVVAQPLHVCRAGGVGGCLDGDLVVHAGWIVHLFAADERACVRLVSLATISAASLANCQDGRECLVLVVDLGVCGLSGLNGGCVHRYRGRRRLEGSKTAGVFLNGHLRFGAVQHAELAVLFAEGSELLFGLCHALRAVLHVLDSGGKSENDVFGLVLQRPL